MNQPGRSSISLSGIPVSGEVKQGLYRILQRQVQQLIEVDRAAAAENWRRARPWIGIVWPRFPETPELVWTSNQQGSKTWS
jgi:hypothetical protein